MGKDVLQDGRDLDLENTVGGIFVMEYQINRLVPRLIHCANTKSNFTFMQKGKMYVVSLNVDVIGSETNTTEDEDCDLFSKLGLGMP